MDLNDIWQEHKIFITSVIIGSIIFLISFSWISSSYDTKGLIMEINRTKRTIARGGKYGRKALLELRNINKKVLERLKKDREKIEFKTRKEFDASKEQYPYRLYATITGKVQEEIRDLCDQANVRLDSRKGADRIGLPPSSPIDKEEIRKTLIGLDLAHRGLLMLIQAGEKAQSKARRAYGLVSIDKIIINTGGAKKTRFMTRTKEKFYLEKINVEINFTSCPSTLQEFLRIALQAKSPIQFESIKASKDKKNEELIVVNMVLTAATLQQTE